MVKFDGGLLSSGWRRSLALLEVEQRLRVADRLAACMIDPRAADQITHSLADVIRFRLLMISPPGYEDGNDANSLRRDPMFKMALDLSPIDRELCSQSRRQYRGWKRKSAGRSRPAADARQGDEVDLYCEVLRHGSQTDHAGHRRARSMRPTVTVSQVAAVQRAHYDEYGFQPIVVFDGEGRFITCRASGPRQAAERQGDQALPGSAVVARDPRSLA